MREMKNSGIEWIGITPLDWRFERGKYMFTQRNMRGNSIELQLLSPTQKYGVIPQSLYESLTGMNAVKLNEHTDLSLLKTIHKGDFCISLRSFQGGFEYSDYEGVVSPAYQVFYPIAPLYSGYYKYLFKDMCFIEKMNSYTMTLRDGKNIAFADFGSTYIPFPPLAEQKSIATYLDTKCAEIDALTADIQTQIDTLEQYKRSVVTEAVTRGLNPDAEMKDSGVQWIGNVPSTWIIDNPKYHFTQRKDRAKKGMTQLTASQKYGVITQTEYMELTGASIVTVQKDFDILKLVKAGDFVIHMRSFQGGLEYSEKTGSISSAYVMLIPNETIKEPRYYKWFFKSPIYIDALSSTSNLIRDGQAMRWANFIQLPIPIPPAEEQTQIADYLDAKVSEIDSIIDQKKEQLETIESYKKSLIYEYVTGKKEVPVAESDVISVILDPHIAMLGMAIDKLGKDIKGKTQLQKILYLLDEHLGFNHSTQYYRYAHGPYDLQLNSYIDTLTNNHWYEHQRHGADILVKGTNHNNFIAEHGNVFAERNAEVDKLINFLKPMKTRQVERIATLFAAWNDFIIDGNVHPTDDQIINEVMTNWTDNKANMQYTTWRSTLAKMKKHGIIPKGKGLHTLPMSQKENDNE